ncbi:hypothetical protein [Duganella sp. HH101]|uniref:hypothetical protein n=1 Tax=Duganella sp. HH101 TaxID=1781066 RepID=UPI000874FB92|nr:hypothetical protein [Duganella sp. HH101]
MRKLTDEEDEAFSSLAEMDPEAAERMADAWRSMSDEGRKRFVRLSERVAALPKELELTTEQLQAMADNDTDYPFN